LLEVLDRARDRTDAEDRLRVALRRAVESVYLLVVRRGRGRAIVAVQVRFRTGVQRSYLIAIVKGQDPLVRTFATVGHAGELDLRRPADAAALEKLLAGLDLEALAGEPAKGKRGR
jgi:hypothetical protein